MAVNMQVQAPAIPTNPQARALFDRLGGISLQEKMQRLRPTKISPFMDALYTNFPALGRGVRARQGAEYLLRNFAEGVKKMNEADGKLEEALARKNTGGSADEIISMLVAGVALSLYNDAMRYFENADEEPQALYCVEQGKKAMKLSEKPEEKKPQAQAARPGGVRSGRDVATAPERAKAGGPKEWDWRAEEKKGILG